MTAAVASTRALVALRDVSVRLGGRTVLQSVNADIAAGEFVVVLGPNGAGKTTLLRLLLGLQRPSSGTVLIDGRPAGRGSRLIGYAPQIRELDRDLPLRGSDLVGLGLDGDRWGLPLFGGAARRRRLDATIRQVGAEAFADGAVGRLSGGEQQRLLLAQALLNEPPLLLLDEPLASLDLRHQQEMVTLIAGFCRRRTATVILVTHDVNPLLGVLDRVLYLAGGRAVLGTVAEVIQPPVLSRLYGSPVEVFQAQGRLFVAALPGAYI